MKEPEGNVVRFRPKPKRPPPPPKAAPVKRRPTGERAVNWSRAPKALIIIGLFFLAMWLVGLLANFISGVGV
jgi:hypothetical protein